MSIPVAAPARKVRVDRDGLVRCRVCGCTEIEPCNPPCSWAPGEYDLCSACESTAEILMEWLEGAHRANMSALMREVGQQQKRESDKLAARLKKAGGK